MSEIIYKYIYNHFSIFSPVLTGTLTLQKAGTPLFLHPEATWAIRVLDESEAFSIHEPGRSKVIREKTNGRNSWEPVGGGGKPRKKSPYKLTIIIQYLIISVVIFSAMYNWYFFIFWWLKLITGNYVSPFLAAKWEVGAVHPFSFRA